jgi:hypothetical protein
VGPSLTVGGLTAFASGFPGFVGGKPVGRPFAVGRDSSFARDLSFLVFVHRGKPAPLLLCHGHSILLPWLGLTRLFLDLCA